MGIAKGELHGVFFITKKRFIMSGWLLFTNTRRPINTTTRNILMAIPHSFRRILSSFFVKLLFSSFKRNGKGKFSRKMKGIKVGNKIGKFPKFGNENIEE